MDSGVVVVVKGALDFQLLLQIALKLPVDVVHHRLIAAGHTSEGCLKLQCYEWSFGHIGDRF